MTSERIQRMKYVIGDYLSSNVAWLLFNVLRYNLGFVKGHVSLVSFLTSYNVIMGQIVFLYFIQKKGWLGVNAFPARLTEREYKDGFFRRGQKHAGLHC